jgi:hypothetical protein
MHRLLRSECHNHQGLLSSSTHRGLDQLQAWLLLVPNIGLGSWLPSNSYRNSQKAEDGLNYYIWFVRVASSAVSPGERTPRGQAYDELHLGANETQNHHHIP